MQMTLYIAFRVVFATWNAMHRGALWTAHAYARPHTRAGDAHTRAGVRRGPRNITQPVTGWLTTAAP